MWCVLSGASFGRETREKGSKERGTIAAQGRGEERERGKSKNIVSLFASDGNGVYNTSLVYMHKVG